jgi:hypothetical protein
MYYSYDKIITLSLEYSPYEFPAETNQLIHEIKKQLFIHNKTETFKITKIHKQEDYCGTICKLLNKLTQSNYDKLKVELFELIANIEAKSDIDIITNKIFQIASSNIHLSKLFSALYKELIQKNNTFYTIFQDNFIKHSKSLSEIHYISPNEDYDGYCNYVKKIDQLKAGLSFFSNLMKYNICSLDNIVDLCKELLGSLKIEMIHKNNMEYKEELLQSIFIIIKEILDYLLFHKEWEYIYNTIIELKQHPNINPKLKFKCMDITDFVKNHMR